MLKNKHLLLQADQLYRGLFVDNLCCYEGCLLPILKTANLLHNKQHVKYLHMLLYLPNENVFKLEHNYIIYPIQLNILILYTNGQK